MKLCQRCHVVFHFEEREKCLYCNAPLVVTTKTPTNRAMEYLQAGPSVLQQIIKGRGSIGQEGMAFIVSTYFRIRSFCFIYVFSRNEFKSGEDYRRFFIQPVDLTSILSLPWQIVNFFDSIFFRLLYTSYCEDCDCKYIQPTAGVKGHDKQECAYNQEYKALIQDIISGKITDTEENFKRKSVERAEKKQRSAYNELCAQIGKNDGTLDVACVWFSTGLIAYFLVWLVTPIVMKFVILS